jgi:virulence-associated protein VapD
MTDKDLLKKTVQNVEEAFKVIKVYLEDDSFVNDECSLYTNAIAELNTRLKIHFKLKNLLAELKDRNGN